MSDEHWLIEELEQHLKEKKEAKFSAEQKKVIEYFTNNYAKEKIQNLSLEKYTNIFDKNKPSETEYLCHFLEITSSVFGSSRPGNATQFGIYKRKDQKQGEYYFPNNSDNKPADTYFNDKIRPILESLCKEINGNLEDSLVKIFNNDEDSPIQAKQCLLKFVYLNNMDKLINIYRKETLQAIGTALGLDQERIKSDSILELNYAISKEIIRELKLDEDESRNVKLFNIGERLWQMFGATFPITAKNTILYGAPGTGKTFSTIKSIEDEIVSAGGNIDEQFCLVQFHPSYSYEDFIDGIKPTKVGSGAVNLELVNGKFKEMCIRAFKELSKNKGAARKYYFVADEINRAELSRVFGELLLCLEEDKRLRFEGDKLIGTKVQTQNSALWESKHAVVIVNKDGNSITNEDYNNPSSPDDKLEYTMYFGVPENLYFIGTMNDIDRSIDSFDMALRRRFFWKKCECNYDVIANHYQNLTSADFIDCCRNLNNHISGASDNGLNLGSSYELGHSYFMSSDKKLTAASKNEMWENHIQPLIREYLRAYTEIEIKDKLKIAKAKFLSDTEQEDINNDN